MSSTSLRTRPIVRALAPITAALVLISVTATPASAREDAGPDINRITTYDGGCPLQRVDSQLVRCDNLSGNGVSAPAWIPGVDSTARELYTPTAHANARSVLERSVSVQLITRRSPVKTLGDTDQWAWAQRLERELCANYGDSSCSG